MRNVRNLLLHLLVCIKVIHKSFPIFHFDLNSKILFDSGMYEHMIGLHFVSENASQNKRYQLNGNAMYL